jgi:hypothetical protein
VVRPPSRAVAVLLAVAVLVTFVGGGGLGGRADAAAASGAAIESASSGRPAAGSGDDLVRTLGLSLTPERPGDIRVEARFSIPDSVETVTASPPDSATVVATDGFDPAADDYEWDGRTEAPSLTYRLPVNLTTGERRATAQSEGRYTFADPGSWALVATPTLPIRYGAYGGLPDARERAVVDGEGVAGSDISYLGPYREHTRTVTGQRLWLVVPEAATMATPPAEILDGIGDAARGFPVGERDEEVLLVAAPTGRVDWLQPGIQRGDSDLWVQDDRELTSGAEGGVANSVWFHEYIHTRQDVAPSTATRWTTEATADYYAALFTIEGGHDEFERFRDFLAIGGRSAYDDIVLADRSTWRGTGANYWKGALALGAIDGKIRDETGGERTLADVLDRLHDRDRFGQPAFLDTVESVGGDDARAAAARYATTTATAPLWNESEHVRTFGLPRPLTASARAYRVEGPYRNRSFDGETLVVGETLSARVVVASDGRTPGALAYDIPLVVDDRHVTNATASVGPGDRTTVSLAHRFGTAGQHRVWTPGDERTVTVRRPATASATGVEVPDSVGADGTTTVTATVENGAERPGRVDIAVTVDGERAASRTVRLGAGERRQVAVEVAVEGAGGHTLAVNGIERQVTVPTPTPSPTPTGSGADGFGVSAAVVGMCAVLWLVAGRTR